MTTEGIKVIEVLGINTEVEIVSCDGMGAVIRAFTVNEFHNVRYKCVYWLNNDFKEVWLAEDELRVVSGEKIKIGFSR